MHKPPICVLMMALALVGGGQTALAGAAPQDERDFAVDHAIGGLKKGSRMLAPESRGVVTLPSRLTPPGGAQGGGGTGVSVTEAPSGGGGAGTGPETGTGMTEQPSGSGSETVSEPPAGGGTGGETEPPATTDTGASNDLIELDVDVDTTTGAGSADLSVGGEPVAETDVSTGADLGEATEPVTEETGATLETGVVTDTTTIDAGTETTEGSLTVDVSAGSDTLGEALLGTGSELDPDATTAEEPTDILDDCSTLDPLSLPEHCL